MNIGQQFRICRACFMGETGAAKRPVSFPSVRDHMATCDYILHDKRYQTLGRKVRDMTEANPPQGLASGSSHLYG